MKKDYQLASKEYYETLEKVLSLKENEDISGLGVRWVILTWYADEEEYDKINTPFVSPYEVKLCSKKDKLLKNADVEIVIEEKYWDSCVNEIEKIALIHSAVGSVCPKSDKFGNPKFGDDGRVELKLKKADIVYSANSEIARLYGRDSVEVKTLMKLKDVYEDVFRMA